MELEIWRQISLFENTADIECETESVDSESAASQQESMESVTDSVENMLETGEQTRDYTKQSIENIKIKLRNRIKRMDQQKIASFSNLLESFLDLNIF